MYNDLTDNELPMRSLLPFYYTDCYITILLYATNLIYFSFVIHAPASDKREQKAYNPPSNVWTAPTRA